MRNEWRKKYLYIKAPGIGSNEKGAAEWWRNEKLLKTEWREVSGVVVNFNFFVLAIFMSLIYRVKYQPL